LKFYKINKQKKNVTNYAKLQQFCSSLTLNLRNVGPLDPAVALEVLGDAVDVLHAVAPRQVAHKLLVVRDQDQLEVALALKTIGVKPKRYIVLFRF